MRSGVEMIILFTNRQCLRYGNMRAPMSIPGRDARAVIAMKGSASITDRQGEECQIMGMDGAAPLPSCMAVPLCGKLPEPLENHRPDHGAMPALQSRQRDT